MEANTNVEQLIKSLTEEPEDYGLRCVLADAIEEDTGDQVITTILRASNKKIFEARFMKERTTQTGATTTFRKKLVTWDEILGMFSEYIHPNSWPITREDPPISFNTDPWQEMNGWSYVEYVTFYTRDGSMVPPFIRWLLVVTSGWIATD